MKRDRWEESWYDLLGGGGGPEVGVLRQGGHAAHGGEGGQGGGAEVLLKKIITHLWTRRAIMQLCAFDKFDQIIWSKNRLTVIMS